MRPTLLCLVAIGSVMVAGCTRNQYQVRITPLESGFERTLTCWTVNAGDPPDRRALSSDELAKIGQCYGLDPEPGEEGRNTFRGKFTVETPQDVGGAGRLERIETSLGTLWIYVERFRGNDDLEGELAKRREAVDTLVDLTIGWLHKEFGNEARFQQLEDFASKRLRNDLKNLAVYMWVAETNSEDLESHGFLERLWLFARERDYLPLHDLATIVRSAQTEDSALALGILARLVARELEIEFQDEALAIFRDPKRLNGSWTEHVRGSDYYGQYLQMQQDKTKAAKGDKPPEPDEAIEHLLLEAFIQFDVASHDQLEVTLDAKCEPISTNGKWNAAKKTVTWDGSLGDHPALPTVCSATWAVPNAEEQKKRFGQTLLAGQALADYAMWVEALSNDEAEQWGKLLTTCKPDGPWQEAIKSFQFDEMTPATASLADQVKSLLIEDHEE